MFRTRRIALAALTAFACQLEAQGVGRALTIEDYYRVLDVGAPQMSPDGRFVAFTVSRRIEATNGDSSEVWLSSSTGGITLTRVSATGTHATSPQWDPNGRLRLTSGGRYWWYEPSGKATLTDGGPAQGGGGRGGRGGGGGGGGDTRLNSPDGKWTAIVRAMPPVARPAPTRTAFEQRHEERFQGVQFDWLNFQRDGAPFPAPNANDPYVSPPQEIVIAQAGTSEERQLTRLGLRPGGTNWNPGGTALAFTADSQYRDERTYGADQVWTVSSDGVVRRLTSDADHDHSGAAFSPDGRWILSTHQLSTDAVIARKLNHGGPTDIVLIPADGGAERVLTANWDYLPAGPRWSRDGRFVYFTGGVGGTTHLFRVRADGGDVEQVTRGERRINAISFNRDLTRMAFTVGRIEGPSEVFVADIDGNNERQLTNIALPFTTDVALSKGERVRYASKDGTMIEGWLLAPHGYRPDAGPYPLVVNNHGGPHSAVGYSFDFKNQLLAANGYFVLTVNFRSSTGYGEKFLWGTWGAWGDRDGEDVIAGIDYAISKYPIDRNRVATIGHSYGGFMSNWLIVKYPERFAAAAVGAGIVNWASDYGTADIARTKETEFFGTPWEEDALNTMMRQSPLTYAGKARAATLFIHGEVDQRVPYSEAEQMYVALKKNGVPAKMIQYKGMPHSISGSWNNVHRMINELRWLDTYTKAKGVS
jgi:dipeptidyl aminopeptidase/acylaminoacyl peptidase